MLEHTISKDVISFVDDAVYGVVQELRKLGWSDATIDRYVLSTLTRQQIIHDGDRKRPKKVADDRSN